MKEWLHNPVTVRLSCLVSLATASICGFIVAAVYEPTVRSFFLGPEPVKERPVSLAAKRDAEMAANVEKWMNYVPWDIADSISPSELPAQLPSVRVADWEVVYTEFKTDRVAAFLKYRNKKILTPAEWLSTGHSGIEEFGRHGLWLEMAQFLREPGRRFPLYRAMLTQEGVICRLSDEGEKTCRLMDLAIFRNLEMVGVVAGTSEFPEGRFILNVKECHFIRKPM